jgi:choline dehydrogenase-like flavoprotein
LNACRETTLRSVVSTFAPPDARIERVTEYAARAIDGLTPQRRAGVNQLLDLLRLPMMAGPATRPAALKCLAHAPIAQLRSGFAALKRLSLFLAYAESAPGNENPTWLRIGYPGPRHDARPRLPALPLAAARDGKRIRAHVAVIGSGAGGGVIASSFARAGKCVAVLEAGRAYDAGSFSQREMMTSELFLDGGLTSTKDLGVAILAGGTLGGGTTVNWCTCLRLHDRVADEWCRQSGIAQLGNELAAHYAAVEARLAIAPAQRHNANNRAILDGARALGVHVEAQPRNAAADCGDGCGYCGFGCVYGKKHSAASTFLPDVALGGGAIYANATAVRIETSGARATSVIARQTVSANDAREFTVDADAIFVCAGALRTPGILASSGIAHAMLGKRLFLHPVAVGVAEFDHTIEPWRGPMQTAYSDAFNYRSGNYGVKIEVAPAHPGLAALALPWQSRAEHAALMDRLGNVATMIALTRDRDPGSIDLDNEAAIDYRVSPFDGENMLAGLVGIFDLAFAAGAVRALTLHTKPLEVLRAQWSTRYRAAFTDRLHRIGIAPNCQILFSAHQMGTATIGAGAASSVVDPAGRVWGYENLIVADASIFPQSSGVNPMLTIMAMASRIATEHGGVTVAP